MVGPLLASLGRNHAAPASKTCSSSEDWSARMCSWLGWEVLGTFNFKLQQRFIYSNQPYSGHNLSIQKERQSEVWVNLGKSHFGKHLKWFHISRLQQFTGNPPRCWSSDRLSICFSVSFCLNFQLAFPHTLNLNTTSSVQHQATRFHMLPLRSGNWFHCDYSGRKGGSLHSRNHLLQEERKTSLGTEGR